MLLGRPACERVFEALASRGVDAREDLVGFGSRVEDDVLLASLLRAFESDETP